jgi:hypothetical protein
MVTAVILSVAMISSAQTPSPEPRTFFKKYIHLSDAAIESIERGEPFTAELTGETGFLAKDAQTWTSVLRHLVNDAASRRGVGRAAYRNVVRTYGPNCASNSWQRCSTNLLNVRDRPSFKAHQAASLELMTLAREWDYVGKCLEGAITNQRQVFCEVSVLNDENTVIELGGQTT